jgi:hypothetical protein
VNSYPPEVTTSFQHQHINMTWHDWSNSLFFLCWFMLVGCGCIRKFSSICQAQNFVQSDLL